MKVVLLCNDAAEREIVLAGLSEAGAEILECSDLDAVKGELQRHPIEILISDYHLRGVGEGDLPAQLMKANQNPKPFLIYLVDETEQTDAAHALQDISGDYIARPLTLESVKSRIAVAMRNLSMIDRFEMVKWESQHLALYDSLTGVFNRQAIYDHALAEVSRAQRTGAYLSLAMIEIVRLKEIEDEHGMEIRDQVIRYVSSAVRANVRIYDLLGRWMGPKLMLALPNTSQEDAVVVIERIRQSIQAIGIDVPGSGRLSVEVKFGITSLRPNQETPLYVLVEQANDALEKANSTSKQQVFVFHE